MLEQKEGPLVANTNRPGAVDAGEAFSAASTIPRVATKVKLPTDAAYSLARALVNYEDADLGSQLAEPWRSLYLAVQSTDPTKRLAVLQNALRILGYDQAEVCREILSVDPDSPPPLEPKPYTTHWAAEAFDSEEPIRWVIDGILERGSVNMWYGSPGTKKTYSALHAGLSVATGQDWLGRPTSQGTVLVVDEESGNRRMRRRLREAMLGLNAPQDTPLVYVSLEGFNLASQDGREKLDNLVAETQPILVILDALADLIPDGDENSTKDTQPAMQTLRRLAELYDCAVILIHHDTKTGNHYRGAGAIGGATDTILKVESKQESANIDFTSEKSRDTEPFHFSAAVHWEQIDEHFLFEMAPTGTPKKEPKLSRSESYVIRYLTTNGPSLLIDIARHHDSCSDKAARNAVYALTHKGLVKRTDGGKPGEQATYDLTQKGSPTNL